VSFEAFEYEYPANFSPLKQNIKQDDTIRRVAVRLG